MSRIRTLRPELQEHDRFLRMRRDPRRVFLELIGLADDAGRVRASAGYLRAHRYTYDEDVTLTDLRGWIDEVAAAGWITVYAAGGDSYAEIVGWTDPEAPTYQVINRPSKSRLPAPPATQATISVSPHGAITEPSVIPQGVITESSLTDQDLDPEGNGKDPDPDAREDVALTEEAAQGELARLQTRADLAPERVGKEERARIAELEAFLSTVDRGETRVVLDAPVRIGPVAKRVAGRLAAKVSRAPPYRARVHRNIKPANMQIALWANDEGAT